MDIEHGVNEMEEFKATKTLALQGIEPQWGALSSDVSKLGSKEVSKKLRNFPLAIKKACHCEDERSEDVAIAKSLNINEITTQSSIARNDTNRHPELVSGSQADTVFSRFTSHFSRKRVAFTLAEVLITLGIIGVVASLTLPSVIMNYQKKQTVVELKKVYAELQNVIKLSEIDNGPMSEWDYPEENSYVDPVSSTSFIKKYYLPYFKDAQLLKKSELPNYSFDSTGYSRAPFIRLNNGTLFHFYVNIPTGYIWIFADINGEKVPNKVGRDIFVFETYGYDRFGINKYKLRFWSYRNNENNIQALINHPYYGCRKDNTDLFKNYYCGRLIELNNWEIPADYPW